MSVKAKAKTSNRQSTRKAPAKKGAGPSKTQKELRSILEELRHKTLLDAKEKLKSGTAATQQEIGDFYDQASEERDRELDLLLSDRERGKLRQIDEAFERLEEGTYGQCEDCGEMINPKRLRIVPFARTCVECQADKEQEERVMKDREISSDKVYSVLATQRHTMEEDD